MPSHLQRPEVQWRKAELFDHCAELGLGASVEEDYSRREQERQASRRAQQEAEDATRS